jgi:hypothetical protein
MDLFPCTQMPQVRPGQESNLRATGYRFNPPVGRSNSYRILRHGISRGMFTMLRVRLLQHCTFVQIEKTLPDWRNGWRSARPAWRWVRL